MDKVLPALQAVLGASLLFVAASAAWRPQRAPIALPAGRLPSLAWALLALAGGAATLAGIAVPFVAFFGACLALCAALLAAVPGRRAAHWPARVLPGLAALAAMGVALGQPLGLKVLALPHADELARDPAPARVVKTYGEGVWFEGIAAGADGTLYLAANRGLDFARSDYWRHAEGEVTVRSPSGQERSLFRTPQGQAAGVIAVAPDGTLYMSSNGRTPGIWRITPDGRGMLAVQLPPRAWPNGLDFGPDGRLYVADSTLGVVWRVDPRSGAFEAALRDDRLKARPFISLAPGANGLHFRGRELLVTVSDRTTVLGSTLAGDGRLGALHEVARGIPGDDFAVAADGTLFITTHPYNTLVRVSPTGERRIVGDAAQHIVGATDAVFGRGSTDRDTLYVVTDGGAFTGGPATRGELVALQVR